jgi:predicted  nucleic acid-binding Zn-ribbon protein
MGGLRNNINIERPGCDSSRILLRKIKRRYEMKDFDIELTALQRQKQELEKELSDIEDQISLRLEVKLLPKYEKLYVDTYWIKKVIGSG